MSVAARTIQEGGPLMGYKNNDPCWDGAAPQTLVAEEVPGGGHG